jgi:hypothetical protein
LCDVNSPFSLGANEESDKPDFNILDSSTGYDAVSDSAAGQIAHCSESLTPTDSVRSRADISLTTWISDRASRNRRVDKVSQRTIQPRIIPHYNTVVPLKRKDVHVLSQFSLVGDPPLRRILPQRPIEFSKARNSRSPTSRIAVRPEVRDPECVLCACAKTVNR